MYTRLDYINGKCSHREYYAQFVNVSVISLVKTAIGANKLKMSTDKYLNDIPLAKWDMLTAFVVPAITFKSVGDLPSQAGRVCILKEAAKQIKESM